jgi:hypothetical protein
MTIACRECLVVVELAPEPARPGRRVAIGRIAA